MTWLGNRTGALQAPVRKTVPKIGGGQKPGYLCGRIPGSPGWRKGLGWLGGLGFASESLLLLFIMLYAGHPGNVQETPETLTVQPPKSSLDIPDGTPLDEKPLTTVNPSTSSPNDLAIQVEQGLSTILRNITFNHTDNGPLAFPGNMLHSNPEMHLHIVLGRLQERELGIRIRARRRVPTSAPPILGIKVQCLEGERIALWINESSESI